MIPSPAAALRGAAALATALLLSACGGGGEDGGPLAADLRGRWTLTRTEVDGSFRSVSGGVADSGDVDTLFTYPDSAYYFDLRADGGYTAAYPPVEAYLFRKFFGQEALLRRARAGFRADTGTWSLSGSALTLTKGEEEAVFTVAVSGRQATFLEDLSGRDISGADSFESDVTVIHTAVRP